ncbi:MAG: peptidyl-alpha-hydroxyglycine alpha-amidating lyase family protein [Thermodesulfobacteriota bacterium]|nr:peptidyl-alpha-hydroxyglycine alpha-amidating lyase family protein [Thermodesulfobacteriota bacterium]
MNTKMGTGRFTYEAQSDWAKLPAGWSFLEVVDVGVDSKDRVYVFSRGEHPVMVFDRHGNLLKAWGEGLFKRPHGLTFAADNTLYLADDGAHVVQQFTLEGELLMTLGRRGQGAAFMSGQPFNQPTKAALDPKTGEIYISDGYGNARLHKFSQEGKHIFSWGESGTDPGQFNLVHSVAIDKNGLIYVADRENHRIQIFDERGNYLAQWNNMHRPCALHIAGAEEQLVFVGELPTSLAVNEAYPNIGARISIYDLKGQLMARLGDIRAGVQPHQFLAPHGLAIDSRGDIYVGEVSFSFKGKSLSPPRELPSFRKLVRIS